MQTGPFRIWTGALFLLFLSKTVTAQQDGLGSWNILNLKYTINEKWSVFGEAQLRSLRFYDDFHYHEYKAGLSYKALPNLTLSLGAGDYDTYREGGNFVTPKNNDEFRVWPQVVLIQSVKRIKIEQRYRAEFRFTSNGYRNRFRYRLGLGYPFGKNKQGEKPFQLGFSNEIFFTDREPYFERNRALLSLGYKVTKHTSVQIGYLHQFDYRINDETGRDFLQIGLYAELFSKKDRR
jgi:long-subunit fatty acid transport protein